MDIDYRGSHTDIMTEYYKKYNTNILKIINNLQILQMLNKKKPQNIRTISAVFLNLFGFWKEFKTAVFRDAYIFFIG